jgi:hypothetical protein
MAATKPVAYGTSALQTSETLLNLLEGFVFNLEFCEGCKKNKELEGF